MANAVTIADNNGEDVSARLSRLNLPARPLIMDKSDRRCPHHGNHCFCFEYTTLLDRPEYTGKYLRESPEPEVKTPRVVNGATAKKKLKLDQYLAGKTLGTKSERQSAETSPNNADVATTVTNTQSNHRSTAASKSSNHTPGPTSVPSTTNSTGKSLPLSSSKVIKSIPEKRHLDSTAASSPKLSQSGTVKSSSEALRPKKRPRTPSPPRTVTSTPPLPALPALLSPTLPKIVEEALALEDKAVREEKTVDTPSINKANGARTVSGSGERAAKMATAGKKPPPSSSTSSGRSPRPGAASSPGKTLAKKSGTAASSSLKAPAKLLPSPRLGSPRPSKASKTISKHPPAPPTPSLILRLKFNRRANNFRQLSKVSDGKRPRPSQEDDSAARSAKRQKLPGALNVAKAPTARSPAFKSPALKAPKEREAITPPPKKTNGPTSLRRTESSGAAITPSSNRDDDRSGPRKGSLLSNQFNEDYQKFSDLGKAAKHEADRIFRSGIAPPDQLRYALVVSVDSTLCFILSFCLSDRVRTLEQRSLNMEMWRTYVPLSMFISDKAKSLNYPDLYGFCKQMEGVVRQYILDSDVHIFGKTSIPENTSKAPTPDSSNPNGGDRSSYTRLKQHIVRDNQDLRTCWSEGMKFLPYDELQQNFPDTHRGKTLEWVDPSTAFPKAYGKYKYPYWLPLHRNTTPQEVVNFGKRFLDEWAATNKVQYISRLKDVL